MEHLLKSQGRKHDNQTVSISTLLIITACTKSFSNKLGRSPHQISLLATLTASTITNTFKILLGLHNGSVVKSMCHKSPQAQSNPYTHSRCPAT